MPSTAVRLVIDDPENFHLLPTDLKEQIIAGAIATVNVQAALTRKNAIENIKNNFTLRNNFTTSQVQFEQMPKTRLISLDKITSRVGVTEKADYMARQETGGERRTKSGANLAIPTLKARGGNKGSPVLKNMYLSKLKRKTIFVKYSDYTTPGSALVAAAYLAEKNSLMLRYNQHLWQVSNFVKTGDRVDFELDPIYYFGNQYTFNPAYSYLIPARKQPAEDVESIFISQMKKLGM